MPWSDPGTGEFPTLGYTVAQWIQENIPIPDGEFQGQPFILADWQLKFLVHFYRLHPDAVVDAQRPSRAFYYDRGGQLVAPQKAGKGPVTAAHAIAEAYGPCLFAGWDAQGQPVGRPWSTPWIQITAVSFDQPLALDTPVPTPSGWSTIGELHVGDEVFNRKGQPTLITRETGVLLGERCYTIEFSDGEKLIASANHGWVVEDRQGIEQHLTTEELAETYIKRNHLPGVCKSCDEGRGHKQYTTPLVDAWQLPNVALPVHPYILGLWLGDGSTNDPVIGFDARDAVDLRAEIESLLEPHETVSWAPIVNGSGSFRVKNINETRYRHRGGRRHVDEPVFPSLRERLRSLGVLRNKHVPSLYLRASEQQRRALLQGLIDSDGHIEGKRRVCFTNTNRRIIQGFEELVTSLGYHIGGRRGDGHAVRLAFICDDGQPVSRLTRKQTRADDSQQYRRFITNVTRTSSVPVRCVGIDEEDHVFIVGKYAVPTHNTDNVWRSLQPMIELGDLKAEIPDTGITRINLPGGGRIEPVTASGHSRLGQRITFVVQDEAHSWTERNGGRRLADTQRRNLAGMGGRFVESGNAWDPSEDSVAQQTFEKETGVYKLFLEGGDGSIRNKSERKKVLRKLYEDSWWIDEDRISSEIDNLLGRGELAQAERFFMNRIVPGEDRAFRVKRWEELERRPAYTVAENALITVGVDGARYEDALAVVATEVETGYQWVGKIWEKPPEARDDYEHPFDEVDEVVKELFDTFTVWRLYADPGSQYANISPLVEKWQGRWGEKKVIEWLMSRPRQAALMIRRYAAAIEAGDVSHDGNALMARHIANARRKPIAAYDDEGHRLWTISKESPASPLKIDAAAAGGLSWEARGDAVAAGAKPKQRSAYADQVCKCGNPDRPHLKRFHNLSA